MAEQTSFSGTLATTLKATQNGDCPNTWNCPIGLCNLEGRNEMKPTYKVLWEQWFRYGPDADESDFDEKVVVFDTLAQAEQFKADLVSGKHKGLYDRTVNAHDVTITKEESEI